MVTKNLRDGILIIKDGDTPPNQLVVVLDEGNLKYTETDNVVDVKDRGKLDHMRPGDEEPVKVSFGAKFVEFFTADGGEGVTPYEALTHQGEAASWESSNDDGGGVYTVDLEFWIKAPSGSAEDDEKVILRKFHTNTRDFAEAAEANTLSFDGIAYVTKAEYERCQMECETACETALET